MCVSITAGISIIATPSSSSSRAELVVRRIYTPSDPSGHGPFSRVYESVDMFFIAHFVGWWAKGLLLRDWRWVRFIWVLDHAVLLLVERVYGAVMPDQPVISGTTIRSAAACLTHIFCSRAFLQLHLNATNATCRLGWSLSVLWELVEYSAQKVLPNFHECW